MKLTVNVTLINCHCIPSHLVIVLGSAIFWLKINSLPVKSTSHWRKGPLNHCKNIKSKFRGLKATCGTKCSETRQMSHCSSRQHEQQVGVTSNNTASTSCEIVGPQNVDYLNCKKKNSIVFIFKKRKEKKRMPINARSLPEFSVCSSDITFAY